MKIILHLGLALSICVLLLAGCKSSGGKNGSSHALPLNATSGPMQMMVTARAERPQDPRDPQPQLQAMVHLDIYFLDLPAGSVSDNKDFWKRLDEEAVGVSNRDVLEKNGIRTGVAPHSEGIYFSRFFENIPHLSRRSTLDGLHTETMKLDMESEFDFETLFVYLTGKQQPEGKSYEQGTNELMLTFGPAPRNPSAVRITICPTVHSLRKRMQFSSLNKEYETTGNETDRIYDLHLNTDVPQDSFFIIAPGPDSSRTTSVGGCFLIKPSETERREKVILIVPTIMRLNGKEMRVREPLIQ